MVIRNIILGFFMNLLFFCPYLINFIVIAEVLVDFTVFALFLVSVTRETISDMIMPNVFKTLMTPFLIIELIHIMTYVVEVL